jgi:hypothetical protein
MSCPRFRRTVFIAACSRSLNIETAFALQTNDRVCKNRYFVAEGDSSTDEAMLPLVNVIIREGRGKMCASVSVRSHVRMLEEIAGRAAGSSKPACDLFAQPDLVDTRRTASEMSWPGMLQPEHSFTSTSKEKLTSPVARWAANLLASSCSCCFRVCSSTGVIWSSIAGIHVALCESHSIKWKPKEFPVKPLLTANWRMRMNWGSCLR